MFVRPASELFRSEEMPLTKTVPAAVPSDFHSSDPFALSLTDKKTWLPIVRSEAIAPLPSEPTTCVPATVPLLTHSLLTPPTSLSKKESAIGIPPLPRYRNASADAYRRPDRLDHASG